MALKIYAKSEKKLTCAFKNDVRILEIPFQMTELNQTENLKQRDRPDAVRKLYLH